MRVANNHLTLSPSDVNTFLACTHATGLDLRKARGEIKLDSPPRPDAELVRERGERHEADFLEKLKAQHRNVVEIDVSGDTHQAARATEEAMRTGVDVVYQAALVDPSGWRGFADFLIRTEEPSDLGDHSYEVYDTKLAKYPKPYFIVQLAYYTEQVARIQGAMPAHMHVVLGTNETKSYRYEDFAAYVRRVRSTFLEHLEAGAPLPYPYPVEHCDYCHWWARCRDKRRADDHLSLVAGLSRGQAIKLEAGGVATVEQLASLPEGATVSKVARDTLDGLHLQAELQVHTRTTGEHVRRFLPLEEERGFLRMPAPSAGDVFFDIEGDPYWGDEGLEYLLGTHTAEGDYRAIWAHDAAQERKALETWLDWITERLAQYPDMHVYHYNHYEPTALKRLVGRYGTRDDELDELLRREVFVDLYTVVRQAMRVGEESYSLKQMEHFYPLERDADVTEAGGSILAYEDWLESRDGAKLEAIEEYNADDCLSTLALRDWLLSERAEAECEFGTVLPNRKAVPASETSEEKKARLEEITRLQQTLRAGLPPEGEALSAEERARQLAAELLEYHRREEKPAWWAYFDRHGKSPDELRDEDSEAIGDLTPADDLGRREEKRSWIIPLRYPAQQHKVSPGSHYVDPKTEGAVKVVEVDDDAGVVWIKRGKQSDGKPLPRAIGPGRPFGSVAQQRALRQLAARIVDHGVERGHGLGAAVDLLMRRPPRNAGHEPGTALHGANVDLERLKQQVAGLDRSALFIQGPPGSGKTYTGARLVVDLIRRGRRVGVTATSHKAIHNMLDEIEKVAVAEDVEFRGLKKSSGEDPSTAYDGRFVESSHDNADFPPADDYVLLAGTPWLFAREELEGAVDVLFVDEAGQVALADALAVSHAATSVVLLGDPQQLAHVSQGKHPHGSGCSVLQHLLGDDATIPPTRGIFLDQTWRMHPDVCAFVSETMYDSRLESAECCTNHTLVSPGLTGTGLRYLPVDHEENQQQAPEEADLVAREVEKLLDGGTFVNSDGEEQDLDLKHILVVAPYNAQVRLLAQRLPPGARVGTVDKFQGQQAPIVFFSMTSSSGENVPRGMDFLFSRNRLNVAVSRAQCMAVVVSSPRLLSARCNSVDQMRLVNSLCRFVEMAEPAVHA